MKNIFFLTFLLLPISAFATKDSVINYADTSKKVVALTFDADITPRMLKQLQDGKVKSWYNQEVIDILKNENVPATLFLTGMWIEQYASTTEELANNQLFEIGNHSYSHPAFGKHCYNLKVAKEVDDNYQVIKTDELLNIYAPNHKMYFRFPGLCYDNEDLDKINKLNYQVIGGDVYGGDGFQNNPNAIIRNVLRNVKPGSIVVLHMMGGPNAPQTGKALPTIIKKLKEKGYEFVKVSDLLNTATTTSPTLLQSILNILGK